VTRGTRRVAAIVAAFLAGVLVDSWLRVYGPPKPAVAVETAIGPPPDRIVPTPTSTAPAKDARDAAPPPLAPLSAVRPVPTTGTTKLRPPIDGVSVESMKGGFAEARTGHPHEAVDILAPRHTPVHAVQDGRIAKFFVSKLGGNTIYQFDPSGRLAYYYAHLQRYADGLHEGDAVTQGQVIGYVGTSGNAPPNTPHLHFAVFELGPEKQWWRGKALDPYLVFRHATD
jgi:murein DD-endopeptidase MepM/ murein hydrolase activator NlpD